MFEYMVASNAQMKKPVGSAMTSMAISGGAGVRCCIGHQGYYFVYPVDASDGI